MATLGPIRCARSHPRAILSLVGALSAALAAVVLSPVGVGASATSAPGVRAHHVTGCGMPTTVLTPADPNGTLSPQALHRPPSHILQDAAQRHVTWLSTLTCKARPERKHPTQQYAATQSVNWAGWQVNINHAPLETQGYWTVPSVPYCCTEGAFSAIWTGLGQGMNMSTPCSGGCLIQDGTNQDQTCIVVQGQCGAPLLTYEFWFEVFPNEPQQAITNFPVSPGDSVATDVYRDSTGTNQFLFCNWTRSACGQVNQSSGAPDLTAEWIVERPAQCFPGCYFPKLANFNGVTLSNCEFDQGLGALEPINANDATPVTFDMYGNDLRTVLASTGGLYIDGQSFTVLWQNYGP
jgi:hypothetical protein